MRNRPKFTKDNIETLFETKFIKVFDLQYAPGKHYFDATRRDIDSLVALKNDEEFRIMLPDAVTCVVVIKAENSPEPVLLLAKEFRYPTGQFLLSPPAGLIDKADCDKENPLLKTAERELFEEAGIVITDEDRLEIINPLLFSTPGMTDESNALVLAVVNVENTDKLTQKGAEGSELFDGFVLLTKEDARKAINEGRDDAGNFYSVYTWAALMYFVSDMWK